MNEDEQEIHVLDTNALIEFSRWLPIDLNKVFWTKLEESLHKGKWILLDIIVDEVKSQNDGLKEWCKHQKQKGFVRPITDDHRNRAVEINAKYKMIDESSGRSTGDTYLIAYAEANKLTIFSREKPRKDPADLYRIPDVCKELNVKRIWQPKIFLEAIGYKN